MRGEHDGFRIRFVPDDDGRVVKLLGIYLSGASDESLRDDHRPLNDETRRPGRAELLEDVSLVRRAIERIHGGPYRYAEPEEIESALQTLEMEPWEAELP